MVKSIEKRRDEGEVIETLPKISVLARGTKASHSISCALIALHKFRIPHSVLLSKRHENLLPFEHTEAIESFVSSKDGSLFVIGSNSKKRPDNLIFGRLFDEKILDVLEFKLGDYAEIQSKAVFQPGIHPIMMFQGELFETDEVYVRAKNFFLDFFAGRALEKVDVLGMDKLICFTATQDGIIHFNCYSLPDMAEIAVKFTLQVRRNKIADEKVFKNACKEPKLRKKTKNVKTNALKEKRGNVHVQQQDIKTIALKKRKAKKVSQE